MIYASFFHYGSDEEQRPDWIGVALGGGVVAASVICVLIAGRNGWLIP